MNNIKMSGRVRLQCHTEDGTLKWDSGWLNNTISNEGLAEMVKLSGYDLSGERFRYLAVGTNTAAEVATHTALGVEITDTGLERAEAVVTAETTTASGDTLKLAKVWTATGSKTIEEVGIFNSAAGGIMLGRKLTGTKAVDNGETLTGQYEVTIT